MRAIQRDDGPNSVLGRALTLLHCFGPQDGDLSLGELSRRTGIPKATVHRLVSELARWGVVERADQGVHLGMRLFELGQLAPRQRTLREAALPYLRDLHEATRETVHLAVLDEGGLEVVYLEKVSGKRGPALPSRVGGRMPSYCTGVGKALLAFSPPSVIDAVLAAGLNRVTAFTIVVPGLLRRELAEVRRTRLSFEREESTPGVVCVASPLFGPDQRVIGAVSIAGWSHRLDTERVSAAVRTASVSISRELGAHAAVCVRSEFHGRSSAGGGGLTATAPFRGATSQM
jgi:IclR family acetate operon transcriptional repressor